MRVLVLLVLFAVACDRPPPTSKPPVDIKKEWERIEAMSRDSALKHLEVKGKKEVFLSAETKLLNGEELTHKEKDVFSDYSINALPDARERFEKAYPNYKPDLWHKD
jgi:hypothetical protein